MKTSLLKSGLALLALYAAVVSVTVAGEDHKATTKDIVETAVAAGNFQTLATALTEAGLVETLKGKGPFTVFAPTDEAFAKIPKADLQALLKDKEQLKRVLLYHVVAGSVASSEVVKMKSAKTIEGSAVKIKVKNKMVMVDNAKVTAVDIQASNGVIHVIDTVIMPSQKNEAMSH